MRQDDLAVLLTVTKADGDRAAAGLEVLRGVRPDLPVVVVADDDAPGPGLGVPVLRVPRTDEGRDAFHWGAVTEVLPAVTLVAAVPLAVLTDPQEVRPLLQDAAASVTGWEGPGPALVPHPHTPRWLIAAYVRDVLAAPRPRPAQVAHAGRLVMGATRPVAEALDPDGSHVRVTARVTMPHGLERRPPWRLRLGVRGPGGETVWSAPTALVDRSDWAGRHRWEGLVARVPLHGVRSGLHELVVDMVGEVDLPAHELHPSVGAVAPGRTRLLRWTVDGHEGRTRYLPCATGSARSTQLLVQQDARGHRAALAWWWRRLRQDLRLVLRGGRRRQARLLMLVALLTRPFFRRGVWLVGEREGTAQDNGLLFFRAARGARPRRRVRYVLDRGSPEWDTVRRLGPVVAHSSWRHQLLMLHADVLADAFSVTYLLPRSWNRAQYHLHLAWRLGALRVFLQHGIHVSPAALQRRTTGYGLVVTSSPRETEALRALSGYDEELVETGLARYDTLTPGPGSRSVLFMTTWRRYLPSRVFAGQDRPTDAYEGSAYERFTTALLRSPRLHEILERHDHRLTFVPHHNLADQFRDVRPLSDRVTVLEPSGGDIQRLVRTCDVFVTDHSSVHFDAAYLGRPVIYARFDREEYERRHAAPSWFDVETEGFGPVTTTLEETLDELDRVLASDGRPARVYRERAEAVFAHHDRSNAERLLQVIDAELARARAERR